MKNTKKMILEKAIELFYEKGFVKASIRDIVKAVGVTNSTVYIYFKNKDEILYKIITDIGSKLLEELNTVHEKYADPVECLCEMVYRQSLLIEENRKEIKIYIEEQYQLPEYLKSSATKQQRQIYDMYYNKICDLDARSILLKGLNKTVIVFSIFSMMNWTYRWYQEDKGLLISEVANNNISILFNGILKEKLV